MGERLQDYLVAGVVFVVWNATRIFVATCVAIVGVMGLWWLWR